MILMFAFGLSAALTPVCSVLAERLSLVDRPASRDDIHDRPTPVLGGLAVVSAAAVTVILFGVGPSWWTSAAVLLTFLVGLVDDARSLRPVTRVALFGVAGILLSIGAHGVPALGPLGPLVAVLVLVACVNGMNLLDGQNGLAAGLAAIAALGLSMISAGAGHLTTSLGLAVSGALMGFLPWNYPVARTFLGNGGAYGVGSMLAVLVIAALGKGGWRTVSVAALCLGIFMFEMIFTVVRRLHARVPITGSDRLHTYDLMTEAIGDRERVTAWFWFLGCLLAGLGALAHLSPASVGVLTGLAVCMTAGGLALTGVGRAAPPPEGQTGKATTGRTGTHAEKSES